ncbi:MAG TPA: adenylate/guanylate cyclase domain-containing protein [Elusimicrobiota bacterium]|jgi:adenylate cyclase|nr:adenylate/guanylate cyclase domain-containing protein [Elusimicrobiota bacterium]
MRRRLLPFACASAFAALLSLLYWAGFIHSMDNRWTDFLFVGRGMEPADPRVQVVAIDDESLRKIGQFPWPRRNYEKLLDNLFASGTKVAGLDILFFERSNPDDDAALLRAARRWRDRLVFAISQDPEVMDGIRFVYPFPALRAQARHFGTVTQPMLDPDGLIRAAPLVQGTTYDIAAWPSDPGRVNSLGVEMLTVFEGRPSEEFVRRVGAPTMRLNLRGQVEHENGKIDRGIPQISAWKLVQGTLSPEEKARLKGALVIVGSTALGTGDHYPTAFSGSVPGLEVHATVIDNLLNDRWLRETPVKPVLALTVVFAYLAWWAVGLTPLWAGLVAVAVFFIWIFVSCLSFTRLVPLDFSAPALALWGTFLVLIVHKTMVEHRRRKEVQQMFGQYLAPEVVRMLVRDPALLRLGGEKRDMTVLFLDIAHFTTISEKMAPEALIQFLNRYLSVLSDVILKRQGVVDKYIGDCVMAFWNAPLDVSGHRTQGCLAAVECLEAVQRLNEEGLDPALPIKPAVRVGINSGTMVVGNTGSTRKLAYTVLGDEVNLGSRLEGANKFFGTAAMASENAYMEAKDAVEGRFLGAVRVVGKDVPIRVYELLARKGALSADWARALPIYEEGVARFMAKEFAAARDLFKKVLEVFPTDHPSRLYLEHSQGYLVVPPPKDWEPVFNLTAK